MAVRAAGGGLSLGDIIAEQAERRSGVDDSAIAARADINDFSEYCFLDDTGTFFEQGDHHRLMHAFSMRHKRSIIWFPIEHGKTKQAGARALFEMGHHPDQQYAYVSSAGGQANKFIGSAGREIIKNHRLRDVFPHLRPQKSAVSSHYEQWSSEALRVEGAPAGANDPTIAGYGIDGQILGARLHGIIVDNVLDRNNTATKLQRERTLETIQTEIMSRLLPGGWIMMIDTSWHIDDALHQLARLPGWRSLKLDATKPVTAAVDVHDELIDVSEYIDTSEVDHERTLWPAQWPEARLDERKGEIGGTAFDRTMRNKPLSASMEIFDKKQMHACRRPEYQWLTEYKGTDAVCTGVDLAVQKGQENDECSFFTARLDPDTMRYVVMNIETKRLHGPSILRKILDIYRRFHLTSVGAQFKVENNAAQDYLLQMMRDWDMFRAAGGDKAEFQRIHLSGFTTSVRKHDLEFGIPSLAVDFEMTRWQVPEHPETKEWFNEMERWSPEAHTGDRLMASWFCREGLRQPIPGVRVMRGSR